MSLSASGLFLLPNNLTIHLVLIAILGCCGGLFLVPLHAFVQLRAPREKLGRILATGSFISWLGVLAASGLAYLLSGPLAFSAAKSFFVLGLLTFGLTLLTLWILPDFLLRFIALLTMRIGYRVKTTGSENIPAEGPALLVANHASWIDALLLLATQQRRIRFIMHRDIYNIRILQPIFRLMGVIPVSASDTRKQKFEFIKSSRQALEEGFLLCIFAEGMITRNGMLHPFKSGFEAITRGTNDPIIPIYIGGAWGSIFSYAHGKPLSKLPTSLPYPVSIHFGAALPATSNADQVQQSVAELAYDYFESQKSKRTSLAEMFIKSARKNWRSKAISDTSGKQLSYGQTASAALALSQTIKTRVTDEKVIGLLLPPSVGGALANLSVSLLGKVPVNLNYTASTEAVQSAIDQCEIRTTITSKRFIERLPDFPLPQQVLYLEELLEQVGIIDKLVAFCKAKLTPAWLILPGKKLRGEELATVIFSSGSTGEPKGVMLSQHNIISNLEAIRTVAAISSKDNVCSALPFFHALGYTATLWLPLLSGFSASYHVNPMEAGAITKLVRKHKSTMLLTTPTFLSTYLRRAKKEDFASLRLIVTGAEKLKEQLADNIAKKYGLRPLEGYGATELAPLITLSLPDVKMHDGKQLGHRKGSVGRPIPGVILRIVNPETNTPLSRGESGLVLVKGPNLMNGYLHQEEKTLAAIKDGWYITGDIGHIDQEGFLHITDRLARFSKIGGEMVPHIKIEEIFYRELKLNGNSLAVTSVADEKKGEKLVVLYTADAGDKKQLVNICNNSDLPNLWRPHPDNFLKVSALPILGSGKLDLCGLRNMATALCS
jgi:acyl-[acyl-carrier-protein]-phospholipid O-acyltransferase/long-chain-fatty-acid--[acyl-carrier-protein] ligase